MKLTKPIVAIPLIFVFLVLGLIIPSINLDLPMDELKTKYANKASRFITVDGMDVHYRDEGNKEGEIILLLHGVNASLHTWEGWVQVLKQDYRVISLDLPGYGLTGPDPKKRYSLADAAKFVALFVQALSLEKFTIAGNSRGGGISWNYAVLYPEKVQRLVLVDAAGIKEKGQRPFMLKLQSLPVLKDLSKVITPRFAVEYAVNQVYGNSDKVNDEIVDRYFALLRRAGNREANTDVLNSNSSKEFIPMLKELTMPTLIMWGEKDVWIVPEYAQKFKELIKHAELIMYPELGHIPMEEAPAKTVTDFIQFLKNT